MKLLEWSLLLLAVYMLIALNSGRLIRLRKLSVTLSAAACLALASHFIYDGYRWPMLPIYIMIGLLTYLLLRKHPSESPQRKRSWIIAVQSSLTVLFLIVATVLPHLFPTKLFDKPTGPFQVGTTSRYLIDPNRSEMLSPDPNDKRELYLQIWYPASVNHLPKASYGRNMPEILAAITRNMELPSFLFSHLKSTAAYSVTNAELSTEESYYPVILFSHGLGLYGFQNTFQMEELASHGYIVVGIQHPYHSLLTVFPDGRTIAEQSYDLARFDQFIEMNKMVTDIWVKDAGFALDYLEKINTEDADGMFANRIDMSRIGMLGHSVGGAAAAQTLLLEPRVKAAVNLDGTLTGTGAIPAEGLPGPFMQLSAEKAIPQIGTPDSMDTNYWEEAGVSQEEYNKYAGFLDVFENNQRNAFHNGGYHVWIKGASHYTFTDIVLYSPLVPYILKDKINTKLAHRTINEYTIAFFNKYLRQMDSPLLQPSSSDVVEVTVHNKS
jgi:predicted dienelactone hydrolase